MQFVFNYLAHLPITFVMKALVQCIQPLWKEEGGGGCMGEVCTLSSYKSNVADLARPARTDGTPSCECYWLSTLNYSSLLVITDALLL